MSKFIDSIRYHMLNRRKIFIDTPLRVELTMDDDTIHQGKFLKEYRVEVCYGRAFFCEPRDLQHMQDNLVSELRHDIYGDFVAMFLRLERGVYEQDREAILSGIRDMRKEILGG